MTESNTMARRSVESRDQRAVSRSERFVVRVDDQYVVEDGKFTSIEFATIEAAERLADSFPNTFVEKISIFD
jgi:hypothetical protein